MLLQISLSYTNQFLLYKSGSMHKKVSLALVCLTILHYYCIKGLKELTYFRHLRDLPNKAIRKSRLLTSVSFDSLAEILPSGLALL